MDIEKELKTLIKNSIEFDLKEEDIVIEHPKNNEHGDYSSNVALKFCKVLGKNPMDVAEDIKNNISSNLVEKIEIVRPGFINFFVKKDYLLDNIINIIEQGSSYGKLEPKNKSVNVEFASINPTGIIHLGHARGSCFGDSLANVLAFAGYDVTREYYVNDAGNQMNNMALSIIERYKEIQGLESHMEDDYYHGKEITDIAKKLYDEYGNKLDINDVKFFRDYGLKTFLNRIKEDLEAINVNFDVWTSEQTLRDRGLVSDALKKLKEQDYTYEKDGALYLKTTLFGDEKDRVLVKTDNSYTYFMPDIAYHLDKLNRGFDKLIDVFGSDHHGYVARLKAAVTMLGQDKDKLDVHLIQMVRAIKDGKEYKLSKRTGKTITLNDLVEETSVDAVRYFFVARSIDSMMDYDVDLALQKNNENPVYYIEYAHARICSILKDKEINIDKNYKFETITSIDAYNVLAKLLEFPKVVARSANNYAPHLIATYAYELASMFHSYYAKEKVITEDSKATNERLLMLQAIKITIYNALKLIGIESPERM